MLISSKRFLQIKKFLKEKFYTIDEALFFLKALPPLNFVETFEVHIALNMNKKEPIQFFLNFPYPLYKERKICVLVSADELNLYKTLPIDIFGSEELFSSIINKKIHFDVLLTTPTFMPKLIKLVKILGPQNLMPSQSAGTVTYDISKTIFDIKNGQYKFKTDKMNNFHIPFGKNFFLINALKENLNKIFLTLLNHPIYKNPKVIKTISLCTTMSPSIKINISNFL